MSSTGTGVLAHPPSTVATNTAVSALPVTPKERVRGAVAVAERTLNNGMFFWGKGIQGSRTQRVRVDEGDIRKREKKNEKVNTTTNKRKPRK